jgi:DNA-binding NtrC family response regulator
MAKERILIADDEEHMRFFIGELLAKEGYDVVEAEDGRQAVQKFKDDDIDLVILDYKMPVMDGLEAMTAILEHDPQALALMVTAHDSRQLALDAIRRGAYDYFTKPFDVDEMRIVIRRALEKRSLEDQVARLAEEIDDQTFNTQIIGESPAMRPVFETIRKVSDSDVTVLICGESGTGKELVAKAIHYASSRNEKPFLALNCAAIPDTLLESELFGHEKGAFTGADSRKIGKFELAARGTLFLDEIGDMNLSTQAKILRVLQEREFQRVGGSRMIESTARILSATNKNLVEAVQSGQFREDLYFRLNVIPVHMPPLRERKEDIPLLVKRFLQLSNSRFDRNVRHVSEEVMDLFLRYNWPGNIRQLENVMYRATILANGNTIVCEDLPPELTGQNAPEASMPVNGGGTAFQPAVVEVAADDSKTLQSQTKEMTESMERQIILQTLEQCKWRRGQTAERLGMSRRSLLRKMKKYEIQ